MKVLIEGDDVRQFISDYVKTKFNHEVDFSQSMLTIAAGPENAEVRVVGSDFEFKLVVKPV